MDNRLDKSFVWHIITLAELKLKRKEINYGYKEETKRAKR